MMTRSLVMTRSALIWSVVVAVLAGFGLQAQEEKRPAEGKNATVESLGLELVWVAPGSFRMGSNNGDSDERPVHEVRISRGYWLGKHEVTNGEYQAFLKASGYDGRRDADGDYLRHHRDWQEYASTAADYPTVCVSWNNSVAFCKWLTERERAAGRLPAGYEYRLPTEAEWEYAARGGVQSRSFTYAGSNRVDEVAWYGGNSDRKTHPVGGRKPNELGLHDMSGNVWEWCHDWYQDSYSGLSGTDPAGPGSGSNRVNRGGGWIRGATLCRSANRCGDGPADAYFNLGFRVALAAPVPAVAP